MASTTDPSTHFAPTSRYATTEVAEFVRPDGTRVSYLRRRFVPDPASFAVVAQHRVIDKDRLDRLAALYLGDPELFWRLADANGCLDPRELEALGRRLNITLPQGMAGPPRA
jgi:hypothetical protein